MNAPHIGELRHRITIQRPSGGRDSMGGIDEDWDDIAIRIPAKIEPARVLSAFGGAQLVNNYDTLIIVRWHPAIRDNMRVVWDVSYELGSPTTKKYYEITGVRVVEEKRRFMFLHCIERQADGWRKG